LEAAGARLPQELFPDIERIEPGRAALGVSTNADFRTLRLPDHAVAGVAHHF
jgi:hypothetical protein